MSRDMQRKRVYAAERATANVLELELGHDYGWGSAPMTPKEAQAFVNKVMRSVWTRKRYGVQKVTVVHNPQAQRGRGCSSSNTIWTAGKNPKSLTKRYLLHEIAHVVTPNWEHHGPLFCQAYIALVQHFLGKQTADVLTKQMKALKIRVKPKVERAKRAPLTEEQKDVLRERLAKARINKEAYAAIKKAETEIAGLRPWVQTYRDAYACAVRVENQERVDDLAQKIALVEGRIAKLHALIGNVKYTLAKPQMDAERAEAEAELAEMGFSTPGA